MMMEIEYREITELLWKVFAQLFKEDEELIGEVQESMKSVTRLTSDDLRDALRENEELLQKNKEIIQEWNELFQNHEASICILYYSVKRTERTEMKLAYIFEIFLC